MENFPQNIGKSFENPEKLFKNRLDNIFNTQLTVENILDFANDAMNQLVSLIDEVKTAYQKETNSNLTGKDLEDKAFEHYNLQGIIKLLDKIQEKSEQIEEIYQYIKEITQNDELIVPPDKLDLTKTTNGDIPWERKKNIPRLATLLYILETDFNIPKEEVNIIEGIVSNEQMRTEPYYRVEINELNRLVYVCIEEGNVTYIFDQKKLKENNIEVELMDILTKQERNEALEQYPNLGTKLRQSKYWRENISDLLAAEKLEYKTAPTVEKTTTNDENIPQVSTSEFDEWRGFWTDLTDPENPTHWGNKNTLAKYIESTNHTIKKHIETLFVKSIRDPQGTIRSAYCYEDLILIPEIKKLINTITVAKENNPEKNQWRGFWTDENGKHWGQKERLEEHTKLTTPTITKYVEILTPKKIKDLNGTIQPAYCYEDVIKIPEIEKLMNATTVEKKDDIEKNQWRGFWTDSTGKHWANKNILKKYTELDNKTITKNIETLTPKDIKSLNGAIQTTYCYEDFIEIPEIKKLINTPAVSKKDNLQQNQWYGFWTDENGKHWTNQRPLANRIGLNRSTIIIYITKLSPKKIRGLNGAIQPAYCYEDLIQIPEIQELINTPAVAKEDNFQQNQWEGFWTDLTDPDNPKHWTNIGVLSKHIDMKRDIIEMHLVNLPSIKTKNRQGKSISSYCYEDLIKIPEIQELLRKKNKINQNS